MWQRRQKRRHTTKEMIPEMLQFQIIKPDICVMWNTYYHPLNQFLFPPPLLNRDTAGRIYVLFYEHL